MNPTIPRFSQGDQYDVDLVIGEDVKLPIHVRRMSRTEWDAFWKQLTAYRRRGVGDIPAEQKAAAEEDFKRFAEENIATYITVDAGLVEDRGEPVTTGAGLIAYFYTREDVIAGLFSAIQNAHLLTHQLRKNSNSPRDSGTGSAPLSEARGGDRPDSTATSVAPSAPAANAAATVESSETVPA